MKKLLSLVAVMAVAVMMSSTAFAAFTSTTKAAYASFNAEELVFNVDLYDWVSGTSFIDGYTVKASSIAFDVSGITLGNATDQWASGTTFAKINSNVAVQKAGAKITMYTTNSTASGNYKANASRTESGVAKYNGLVRKGNTSTYLDGDLAPIKILCKKVSDAEATYKTTLPADFSETEMYGGSRYLLDIADGNYATAGEQGTYIAKTGQQGGIWVGYGTDDGVTSNWYSKEDVIMFFGAKFKQVVGGDEYGTEVITFMYVSE